MKRLLALSLGLLLTFAGCNSSPEPSTPKRKNVLLITADDLNNDLGCYGHPLVKSPHIDRLSRRGVRFEKAYCQYPVCNPSRSSFMTGLYPDQTGVLTNLAHFREKQPEVVTLPQLFQQHGYFVARVGKIYHYGVPDQIGTDGKDDPDSWHQVANPRGIDREIHDRIHSLQGGRLGGTLSWLSIESEDDQHTDGIGAAEAIRLMEANHPDKSGRPFFLAVGFYRPHTPFVAPARYFDLYPREAIQPVIEDPGQRDDIPPVALPVRQAELELTLDQRREIIQAYFASISFMDAQVGRLLDALDRLGLKENTVVVFLSDHGYHLGRHGLWQKSDLFEGSARVPLIIADPGRPGAGLSTRAITELVDLYPTISELCGLPTPTHVRGQSLVPLLNDVEQKGKPGALTQSWGRGPDPRLAGQSIMGYSIRTPRYRFTEWGDGEYGIELYDYERDPDEERNLADDPEYSETVARLKALLRETRRKAY